MREFLEFSVEQIESMEDRYAFPGSGFYDHDTYRMAHDLLKAYTEIELLKSQIRQMLSTNK